MSSVNFNLVKEIARYVSAYSVVVNESVQRNRHTNEIGEGYIIDKKVSDAILVDFVNYVAMNNGIDFGMYTEDIQ